MSEVPRWRPLSCGAFAWQPEQKMTSTAAASKPCKPRTCAVVLGPMHASASWMSAAEVFLQSQSSVVVWRFASKLHEKVRTKLRAVTCSSLKRHTVATHATSISMALRGAGGGPRKGKGKKKARALIFTRRNFKAAATDQACRGASDRCCLAAEAAVPAAS
ncbi:hypothetical protein L1887_53241 [Cichorium endivia]|nr:hypothetical protein L1887_53241 [Cichorium endivia]